MSGLTEAAYDANKSIELAVQCKHAGDTGSSTLQLLDGATIVARGTTVPVGNKAFVRAGLVEGPAPNLPLVEVEI